MSLEAADQSAREPDATAGAGRTRLAAPSPRGRARRVLAGALALAGLGAIAWSTAHPTGPAAVVLVALVSVAGAATLASYVPTQGLRPALGCTPCAVAAIGSVPVALGLLASGAGGVALVVALAGWGQRIRSAGTTCPA